MALKKSKKGYYKVEEKKFDDLDKLVKYLLKLRLPKDKNKGRKRNNDKENEFWSFRGQRKAKWSLVTAPHKDAILPVKSKISGRDIKDLDNYDQWFSQYKKRMLHSRDHDYLDDKNPWWWLFYAEHHGLYTRLLDWTSNPLVAIYFAVENILSKKDDNTGGAVWALKVNKKHFRTAEDLVNIYKLDPSSGRTMDKKEWFMINPEPVTGRIVQQSGKFSYHPGKKPTPIDKMKRRTGEKLIKLRINPEYNADIRRGLGIMNIHHASLFPSPTGIAYFMNSEWPDIAKY